MFTTTQLISLAAAVGFLSFANAQQCDPSMVTHYNMGDFPATLSSGITVTMSGTNSGTLGPYNPYGCSLAACDVNTIRMDPGDATTFTFSQAMSEVTMVMGVMNTYENGSITTNGGTPVLTANCGPTETAISGGSFEQIGALASPVITISIPGGATQVTVNCFASTQGSGNGVFTIDLLDCSTILCTPTTSAISPIICDSYTSPSGNVWTSSNVYTDTIPNAVGCDSIITVDLTVNNSVTSTDVQSACGSYTWIDGNVYTSSNSTATHTLTNAAGCDSTVTLDLTILAPSTGTDVQSACGSYTWMDGNTYTSSNNTATYTLTNAVGCDSIVTLDLTIAPLPNNGVTQTGTTLEAYESGASYQWIDCDGNIAVAGGTNQSFMPTLTGNYAVVITLNGCSDTSSCTLVDFTGIFEGTFETFKVYPNPTTTGLFMVQVEEQIETIQVFDVLGREIELSTNPETKEIDGTELNAGHYFVRVTTVNNKVLQNEIVVLR